MWICDDIQGLAVGILGLAERVRGRLHALRPQAVGQRVIFDEIVALELELMTVKSELLKLKGLVGAAENVGALPRSRPGTRFPDGRCAGANDDTLTKED